MMRWLIEPDFKMAVGRTIGSVALWILIALFSCLSPSEAKADKVRQIENNEVLSFRHMLQDAREANKIGKIRIIEQDSEGNVWFGGRAGLGRFDGLEFKIFKHSEMDERSLASNSVRAMVTDRRGVLWVATDAGIQIYDPEIENFQMVLAISNGMEKADYFSMANADAEHIWLLSVNSVALLDTITHQLTPLLSAEIPNSPLYHKKLNLVFADREQRVWLACDDGDIFVFNSVGRLLKNFQHNVKKLPAIMDLHIMQDRDDNVWISGRGTGVARVSPDLGTITTYFADGEGGALPGNDVSGIGQDGNGKIWVAVDHAGLTILDPATDQFRIILHNSFDPMGPTSNQPQQLFIDRDGDLWIEQYPNGIDYLGGKKLTIARYRRDPEDPNSISNNNVNYVYADSEKNVWVGTHAGLNILRPPSHSFKRLLAETNPATVLSIAEASKGSIWIGTWSSGIYELNIHGDVIHHFTEQQGLLGSNYWALLGDTKQQLWVGTGSMGLAKYHPEKESFTYYAHDGNNPSSISNNLVWSIIEFDNDSLLIGTAYGLNRFNRNTEEFERIGFDSPLLKSQDIRCLIKLKNGQIWVGTNGGGITVFNQQLVPIARIDRKDGLPNRTVMGLTQDNNGMVWASTLEGVAHINPENFEIFTLTREQGLTSNYFIRDASMVDQYGSVYLGSADGLSVVVPQSLAYSPPESRANINRLFILNREVLPNAPNSPLKKSMLATNKITLNYSDSLIGLGFSTTNLRGGADVRFRYQLDGVDKNWVTATNDRRATYSSLPSGEYIFRVQAGDTKIFWPASEDRVLLVVLPPAWLSAEAKIAYAFLFGATLLIILLLVRLQQKRRSAEWVLKTKNDFLAIMSHEIRTPLTAVIGMLQIVLKDKSISPKTREQIKLGHMNSQALLNITNDIVNINKIEGEGVQVEVQNFYLRQMLKMAISAQTEIAENKGVLLKISVADDVPEFVATDPNRIRQVLTNFVSNALKFTRQGTISVGVRRKILVADDQLALEFSVQDTGIGMSAGAMTKLFEKFEQAEITTSRIYGGTGLGLSICKTLVAAMKGTIAVESREGLGSTFAFTIPVTEGVALNAQSFETQSDQHAYQLNILCAEDFEANQLVIREFIQEMGHTITVVDNGIAALEALMASEFDLILMDGRMPRMDGVAAGEIIRSGRWGDRTIAQKDIPVIALTANITAEDKEKYLAVGINSVVAKPINKYELFIAINDCIRLILGSGKLLLPRTTSQANIAADQPINEGFLDALFDIESQVSPTTDSDRGVQQ